MLSFKDGIRENFILGGVLGHQPLWRGGFGTTTPTQLLPWGVPGRRYVQISQDFSGKTEVVLVGVIDLTSTYRTMVLTSEARGLGLTSKKRTMALTSEFRE